MKFIRIIPYIFFFALCGCTAIENLDELSVLGQYSREKDDQHREVKWINARYDALIKVIEEGKIGNYKDESAFLHSFGEPILKKDLRPGVAQWLYRYAICKFAKDKVYLYFDSAGQLIKWERLPCPSLF